MKIDEKEVKQYASQGQIRTLMLAIKIACVKILEESTGETPILLLDDVFSELDSKRKHNLLKNLVGIQVFLTTANEREETEIKNANLYETQDGNIVPKYKKGF